MNDYLISIDENGQPYIAHRGQLITNLKKGAKSVAKVVDGAKTRYLKTQAEVSAYLNQGKQKAGQAVDKAKQKAKDWSGVTAKEKAKTAFHNEMKVQSRNVSAVKDSNGRYKGSQYQAEYAYKDALDARNAYEQAKKKHPPIIQTTKKANEMHEEMKALEAANIKASRDAGRAQARAAADEAEWRKAIKETDKAYEEYYKTPLGKIEKAPERFSDAINTAKEYASDKLGDISKGFNSAKDKAKGAIDSAKEKAGQAGNKAKELVDSAKDKAKELADSAKDKARDLADKAKNLPNSTKEKVKDVLGYDERERRDAANKAYDNRVKDKGKSIEDKEKAAFYTSPKLSLTTDSDGSKHFYIRSLQKEGLAKSAYNNAERDLKNARKNGSIDEQRRAASEKRMAENEYNGLKGTFEDWRNDDETKLHLEKINANWDYNKTPLGRLESLKEDASEAVDKVKGAASSAANKVKGAADSVADKAKGAATSVKSSYDKMKDEFAASKVNKEVKKAESDFRNFKSKYKAPDAGMFSFDTASGTTVRNKERYDYYTKQAEDTFAYINNNPNLSTSAKQQLLSEAQEYMEYAQKYAWKR